MELLPDAGSLSVEAALSLSLFLFFCFCLIMPMKMLDRQRQIQAVMDPWGGAESVCYVEYCFRSAEEGGAEVDVGRAEDTATSVWQQLMLPPEYWERLTGSGWKPYHLRGRT